MATALLICFFAHVVVRTFCRQIAVVNFELPSADIGAALKPREVVDQLEKFIVGQVGKKNCEKRVLQSRSALHRATLLYTNYVGRAAPI